MRLVLCVLLGVGGVVFGAGEEYHKRHRSARAPLLRASAAEVTAQYWYEDAQAALDKRIRQGNAGSGGRAKNVVMFLGDGMSVPTLAAARTLLGQREGRPGEEAELSFESFPTVGLAKTYCVDAQIADSACTATAYLCGVKNNEATIGITAAVPRRDCAASQLPQNHVESIAAWALEDGRDAGIVTTTRVTHASPSGAYAKIADRDWESDVDVRNDGHDPEVCRDIAYQLIHTSPANQFKVILGGGRREFIPTETIDPEGDRGRRRDGRNLIEEWEATKADQRLNYRYVWNRQQLISANSSMPDYILGLFESGHLMYNNFTNRETEPTLEEMTEVAIRMLSRNENGFFLFVEGGRIDHAHHDNFVEAALDETIELSKAVARAMELLPEEDTLIVVTSDHSHAMAFNGYTHRGGNILGVSDDKDENGVPYLTLSYTNGPGHRPPAANGWRVDVTQDADFLVGEEWRAHVEIPLDSETHGGDDIAVFARGPHHALFSGLYEQSHIPHRMAYVACFGPARDYVCSAAIHHLPSPTFALLALWIAFTSIIAY